MIRAEIFEAMTPDERRELHCIIIDAATLRFGSINNAARYDEASRLELALIKVINKNGDYTPVPRPVT